MSERPARATGMALLAVAAALVAGPAAAAAAPVPTGLSITLADGRSQVHSDQDVTYTSRITNAGSRKVTGSLVLTVPSYVKIDKTRGATLRTAGLVWHVSVPAGKSVTRTVSAHIGTIPKDQLRVTTLASLYKGKRTNGVPVIRTAVANRITGVPDPAAPATQPPSTQPASAGQHNARHSNGPSLWLVVGVPVLAALLLLAGGFAWWRRRIERDPGAAADQPDSAGSSGMSAAGGVRTASDSSAN